LIGPYDIIHFVSFGKNGGGKLLNLKNLENILFYLIIIGSTLIIFSILGMFLNSKTPQAQAQNVRVDIREPYFASLEHNAESTGFVEEAYTELETDTQQDTVTLIERYNQMKEELKSLRWALARDRTVEYVIYSVVDYEGEALTFDETGGFTRYGISSKYNPDIDVFHITRQDAFNILFIRYYLPNGLYKYQSVRLQVALMHMCVLFGKNAFSIAYSVTPKEKLITLRDSDPDFPKTIEKLRLAFRDHAKRIGIKNPKYLNGWLNRIDKVFYIG
jgi:ABC-type multidrug transport system fused ATPase/permease subunit